MADARSKKTIHAINRLLKRLPKVVQYIQLAGRRIELLDIHIHLPEFTSSLWHTHSHLEIHVVLRGYGRLITRQRTHSFEKGQFTITSPEIEHRWKAADDQLLMYVVSLKLGPHCEASKSDVERLLANLKRKRASVYSLPPTIESCINQITDELSRPQLGLECVVHALLQQFLIEISRATMKGRKLRADEIVSDPETDRLVELVDQFLKDNLTGRIDLDTVAKHAFKSKRSVTRHYKRVTGVTIGQKLYDLRMVKAQALLGSTDLPVKTVAFECGMPDVSHFSKQFKKAFNCSPIEYRKYNSI